MSFRRNLERELKNYDGIVLISPDERKKGFNKLYKRFRIAQEVCLKNKKGFFVLFNQDETNLKDIGLNKNLISLNDISERNVAGIVKTLEKTLGKYPRDISLLFAGFQAGDCVYTWAMMLSQEVDDSKVVPIDETYCIYLPAVARERLKKGKIYVPLTDLALHDL